MPHEITFKPSSTQWDKTMTQPHEPLPPFLAEPSRIGQEVSATGKWIPTKRGGRFRTSAESKEMLQEREDIHAGAKADAGVLSIEINHAVGEDAVLVHHVFKDPDALVHYFSTTATQHMAARAKVAKPELHLIRGVSIPVPVSEAVLAKNVPAVFGELLFGYVREDYRRPNQETAINVTAKWTCKPGEATHLEDLEYWWLNQRPSGTPARARGSAQLCGGDHVPVTRSTRPISSLATTLGVSACG